MGTGSEVEEETGWEREKLLSGSRGCFQGQPQWLSLECPHALGGLRLQDQLPSLTNGIVMVPV